MLDDVTVRREPGGQEGLAPTPSPNGTVPGSRPGVLVFSRRGQLLHINRRAVELLEQLDQAAIGRINEIRSESVHELRFHIQETLGHRRMANIWELFEVKRAIVEGGRKLLARGFGLADRNSFEDSHIVIVLEEVGVHQEHQSQRCVVSPE